MKKTVTFLLLLCPVLLAAQDWQNICPPGTTLFKSSAGGIGAFRRDSVVVTGGNDTLFISYRAIRENIPDACMDTTNGSILGRTVLKKGNGWFFFFNFDQDTVRINTQAALNSTWKFFDLANKSYLQAKVTAIATETVLGTTDQVKTITLQAKDSTGADITHILNQQVIKLSRHYGLVHMLDVPLIPRETTDYELAGMSCNGKGLQELTWQKIFDFSPGDEFQYSGGEHYPVSYPSVFYSYTKNEIFHVLEKQSYGTDSVTYKMEYCKADTTTYPPSSSRVHDTVLITYNFQKLATDNAAWFSKLAEEFSPTRIDMFGYADYYNEDLGYVDRFSKVVSFGSFSYSYLFPGCWVYLIQPECPAELITKTFGDGIGQATYQEDCYGTGSSHIHSKWNNLVYYRKGTQTWGTPVASDCWVLTGTDNKTGPDNSFEIFPNPATNEITVRTQGKLSGTVLSFSLYNETGVKVREGQITSQPFVIPRNNLAPGIYLFTIRDDRGAVTGSKKIILL